MIDNEKTRKNYMIKPVSFWKSEILLQSNNLLRITSSESSTKNTIYLVIDKNKYNQIIKQLPASAFTDKGVPKRFIYPQLIRILKENEFNFGGITYDIIRLWLENGYITREEFNHILENK